MTKNSKQDLLQTKIVDLLTDVGMQTAYARKILGDKASDKKVQELAEKRVEQAKKLLEDLEKPLGTTARPFPMWGTQRMEYDGETELEQVLSSIASDSDPLKVFSDRPYDEVVAMAYCDMPVPSMLPLFYDGLERRKPESTNRTQMMIGDPGHGKSFLGALQGRLRSKKSVEVLDCGGKNMRELLFEMVLDFGSGDALPKAIDKRLAAGTLQDFSMALLKDLPGVETDKAGNVTSIDWASMKTAGSEKVEKAFDTLSKISKIEGLDNAGGNALGMNSQYGALVRKFIEGEEIVLDEYNKSREGTDDNLQTIWQFMIGELDECTVENPLKNKDTTSGPAEFTFRREDMKAGFFVTLTGNKKEDGITTRSLNKSVYSRLSPQTLPDPDELDWQHRICQMMVGLPVSTLYTTFKDQADKNPKDFGKWLLWLRETKAKVEGTPIPEIQETLLNNWQNVVEASQRLAKFYHRWAQLTDVERIMTSNNADLIEEVDEEYTKKEGIDFRKIKQHLEQALPIRPKMLKSDEQYKVDFGAWTDVPKLHDKVPEKASLKFGTRLTEFLERMVYEKSEAVGKPKLYRALTKAMTEYGLRDVTLQEAARNNQKSVEQSLNISSFDNADLRKQATLAQKIFCDYLREIDPEIEAEDDQIVTTKVLQDALTYIDQKDVVKENDFFVVNTAHETLSQKPLIGATIKDEAAYDAQGKIDECVFTAEELVSHEDFLASFALPTVSAKNLSAVWDKNMRPLMDDVSTELPANDDTFAGLGKDEAFAMSENTSETGLATTTLTVLGKNKEGKNEAVSVHIFRNEKRNKTVIVSDAVPKSLLAAFNEAGVVHVSRQDRNASAKFETAMSDLTKGVEKDMKEKLIRAFKYRNSVDPDYVESKGVTEQTYLENKSLSDLVLDPNMGATYVKAVVKKQANGPK